MKIIYGNNYAALTGREWLGAYSIPQGVAIGLRYIALSALRSKKITPC